jgi:hypothetical protein
MIAIGTIAMRRLASGSVFASSRLSCAHFSTGVHTTSTSAEVRIRPRHGTDARSTCGSQAQP